MITTITLNAAIDKLYLVDSVAPETVMRVKKTITTAGGKGLNVAKVAALLGEKVRAGGFVGGYNGQYLQSLLDETGISPDFTKTEAETRCCINVKDLSTGGHTEYLEPGEAVSKEETKSFLESYGRFLSDSDVITISGSVPAGISEDFYSAMITQAISTGCKVVLDTSGKLLCNAITAKPTMIKPNIDETEQLTGKKISSQKELLNAAQMLHSGGVVYVVISLGAKGAIMLCNEGAFRASPPEISVVNTVGCGDSMVAGFAAGMRRKYAAEELLSFATAVAASNAMQSQTGQIVPEDIASLQQKVKIERL